MVERNKVLQKKIHVKLTVIGFFSKGFKTFVIGLEKCFKIMLNFILKFYFILQL